MDNLAQIIMAIVEILTVIGLIVVFVMSKGDRKRVQDAIGTYMGLSDMLKEAFEALRSSAGNKVQTEILNDIALIEQKVNKCNLNIANIESSFMSLAGKIGAKTREEKRAKKNEIPDDDELVIDQGELFAAEQPQPLPKRKFGQRRY